MKTVFFDVDTQFDFVLPAGSLYVPGAERRVKAMESLHRFAVERKIPIISTMDAHSENDPEFRQFPPHCVVGTHGQQKLPSMLIPGVLIVPSKQVAPVPVTAPQVIIEKQVLSCFSNPNLNWVLEHLQADRYVVYGVATEYCVQLAAAGLQKLGKPVELVTDAIEGIQAVACEKALGDLGATGVVLRTAAEVMAG